MTLRSVDLDMTPPEDIVPEECATFSRLPLNLQVPVDKLRACADSGEAFRLACIASGLDDKEIYIPLGIDPGYFTNIKQGRATLKASLEPKFCRIVGNYIYPEWRAYKLGFSLTPISAGPITDHDHIESIEYKLDRILSALTAKGLV